MSQHIVVNDNGKYMFGWDQPLQSFFLQKHDPQLPHEENPVVWLGADAMTWMYEVEDLAREASKVGLEIDYATRVKLYGEKDNGV